MKLVTFEHAGEARVGALGGTDVIDLRSAWGKGDAPPSLLALLQGGPPALAGARAASPGLGPAALAASTTL